MSEKVEVQGLLVEITIPPQIQDYKKTSIGIEFPCECGTKRLGVSAADFPTEEWERLGEARRQAEAWKKAIDKASDFVDYYLKTDKVRKQFERFGLLWTGGILTQVTVTCHTCARTYRFSVGATNPIVAERLTPLEVLKRYSVKNTIDFQKTIAEWIHHNGERHDPPIKTPADYIKFIRDLEAAPTILRSFAKIMRETVEKMRAAAGRSVVLNVWLEDLEGSIEGVLQDLKLNCEKRLKEHIEELADLVTEPAPLRVPRAEQPAISMPSV